MRERVAGWAKYITRLVLDCLLEDPRFRRMQREIVLSVWAEQEYQKTLGIVDAFFELCGSEGIVPKVEGGKLIFTNPERLGPELQKVLILYRKDIKAHVERMEDMAKRDEQRIQEKRQRPA